MRICRICLLSKLNVCSIHETYQGMSYGLMITCISNIKINENECYEVICYSCLNKLIDLYEFKLLIERNELKRNVNSKVLKFNTISDIKDELLIDLHKKQSFKLDLILFQNEKNCTYYKNTFIRKIYSDQPKSVAVQEFLKSVKSKPYEDNDINYLESDADEKYNDKKYITKSNAKEKIRKNICIKPVFLKDVTLIKTMICKVRKMKKMKCGKKEGICPYCGKKKSHMEKHLLLHTAERKFRCNDCSRSYYTRKDLEYHVKSHLIQPSLKCNKCIAIFKTKGSLARHMVSHTDVKEFICEMCNKAFKWKNGLLRHMQVHNFSKEFKCDLCNMSFSSKYTYQHHTRVHTGERPYKCELCSQPYSYKRDFNRHCLKKHGVIVDRRSIFVMNDEVLRREKSLMKDIVLRTHGIPTKNEPLDSFHGPQRAKAFAQTLTLLQNCTIPVDTSTVTF